MANVIRCSRLQLSVVYFIYFKFTRVFLFDIFNGCSSSIKETNTLIGKECQTFTIEKNWHSLNFDFLWKKMKKCTNFEERKGARYIWGKVYVDIIVFNCLSSTKSCLRFLLNCFALEIKGFEADKRLRKWGWFQRHNERFPKYLD